MNESIYAPYVLNMAATKRSALRGGSRRRLDDLVAALKAADDSQMSINPDLNREAWDAANDATQKAAADLLAFAGPIMPVQDPA